MQTMHSPRSYKAPYTGDEDGGMTINDCGEMISANGSTQQDRHWSKRRT